MAINKRIIALDIGTKRIGTAVSDALYLGATPIKTIERKSDKNALEEIVQLCKEYSS